jgi:rhodanese-related sulfurtransferase
MSKRIDVAEVIRRVSEGAQLVDVLPTSIFRDEHIPGAVNIPLSSLDPADGLPVDKARPTVVYCFDQH